MPWSGRVPVRRPPSDRAITLNDSGGGGGAESTTFFKNKSVPRQEPAMGEGRMLHAPSVDWVHTNLLRSVEQKNPFSIDPTTKLAQQFGFTSRRSNRDQEDGIENTSTPSTATLSERAQRALREVYRRFDSDQLLKVTAYLNSNAGSLLNRTMQTLGQGSARNKVVAPRTFGVIDEGIFLRLFAAASTLDPIRAASVVATLGYRPNFAVDVPDEEGTSGGMSGSMSGGRGSSGRREATPPPRRKIGERSKRPASASASRRRPSSAASKAGGGSRGGARGGARRPSTAGAKRRGSSSSSSSSGNRTGGGDMARSHSSFLRGAITPRHRRGPMDFWWKFLASGSVVSDGSNLGKSRRRGGRKK